MSKWKMVPVEPTDQMIRAIDGLICSSYLWPVYAYRAMIDAAPVPTAADCTSVCDAYAAENQQFSDELTRLREENERLTGALQEIANTPTTPANHDLVAVIMLAQYALRDDAPTAPPAR